jgi:futalosine hydrolase
VRTILVTAAVNVELSLLLRDMGAVKRKYKGVPALYECNFPGKKVFLAETGMGKVNAALSSTSLVHAFAPDILINTGCAGAYVTSGLSVGNIAAASSEIYGDEGVLTRSGWQPLEYIGIPLAEVNGARYFNEIPLSPLMAGKALMVAGTLGIPLRTGKFVTVSTGSGTAARGAELSSRFDAICESMEGAAVAHVALMHGLDCLEVRGISNMVEERDLSRWNVGDAVAKAQRFIRAFVEAL